MVTRVHTPVMQLRLAGEATEIDLDGLQGLWSAEQYLRLTDQTNRPIEFTDGVIEVLPVPTRRHQAILGFLYVFFLALMQPWGVLCFSPRYAWSFVPANTGSRICCWCWTKLTHVIRKIFGSGRTW